MDTGVKKATLKPNNIIAIKTAIDKDFFRYWVEFLRPLHHLTDREMDVITAFLRKRYILSKDILDPIKLDKYLMNEDTKAEIREECNISTAHFQVIMGKLRKRNIILNGYINPKFIPNVKSEDSNFQLLLYLKFDDGVHN